MSAPDPPAASVYDYSGRLAALCQAFDSERPTIAVEILNRITKERARGDVLEEAVAHVVRYGRLGKQSERRLRAALRAVEVSRG